MPGDAAAKTAPAAGPLRREPNDFWRFSLRAYRLPGVEAACLALQDRCGTDTNLLLYCCWVGSAGHSLDKRTLRRVMAAVARLQADLIQPLRQVRRTLKTAPLKLPSDWVADLRKRVGAVELDLEYLEQCVLAQEAWAQPAQTRQQAPRAAAQASIARYLALLTPPPTAMGPEYIGTLLDACCPAPPSH